MNDPRDPTALGKALLHMIGVHRRTAVVGSPTASQVADHERRLLAGIVDYRDETTVEKYGDPRLLPSTMP